MASLVKLRSIPNYIIDLFSIVQKQHKLYDILKLIMIF